VSCVRSYAQERLFGLGRAAEGLKCMNTGGCSGAFAETALMRALPPKVYNKWVEQEAKAAMEAANLDNFVSCPFCGFSALLPAENSVFECPEVGGCGEASCRKCKKKDHVPHRCGELKEKAQTNKRTAVEEAMTLARLRACPDCDTKFFKTEGCNKMQCRCGTKTCYLCKVKITDYKHFCQTPHCDHKSCNLCPLFSDSIEDDRRDMLLAGKAAKAATAALAAEDGDDSGSDLDGGANANADLDKLLEDAPSAKEAARIAREDGAIERRYFMQVAAQQAAMAGGGGGGGGMPPGLQARLAALQGGGGGALAAARAAVAAMQAAARGGAAAAAAARPAPPRKRRAAAKKPVARKRRR